MHGYIGARSIPDDIRRTLVVPQTEETWLPQPALTVHSANPIWATSSGRVQWVPRGIGRASANGDSDVSSLRSRAPSSLSVSAL